MKGSVSTFFFLLLVQFSQGRSITTFENNRYQKSMIIHSEFKTTTDFTKNTLTHLLINEEFKTNSELSGQQGSKVLIKNKKRKRKGVRYSPPRKHTFKKRKSAQEKTWNREQREKVLDVLLEITYQITMALLKPSYYR